MRLFRFLTVIFILFCTPADAQNVSVPPVSSSPVSPQASTAGASPQASRPPVIVNGVPLSPFVPVPPRDPSVVALETQMAALRRDDYRGMTRLGTDALKCSVTLPFEQGTRLHPQVISNARLLLRKAAEKGVAEAQVALARSYLDGRCGAPQNLIEGYAWMKAALNTNPDISPNAGMAYARSKLPPEYLPQADYQAMIYVKDFSEPYTMGRRIRAELPCPAANGQVGVFLSGNDFASARSALQSYNGKGYPTSVQNVQTPQGCTKARELNRFRVRFAAKASIFDINNFLRQNKMCITMMMPQSTAADPSATSELDVTDVVLSAEVPPSDVAMSDKIITGLQGYAFFQNAVPYYEGEAECPAGSR